MKVLVPDRVESLTPWVEAGVLEAGDVFFADFLARHYESAGYEVLLAAALCSWAARHGHARVALGEIRDAVTLEVRAAERQLPEGLEWPDPLEWAARLGESTAVNTTSVRPDPSNALDDRPLVLWDSSVYLQRHWVDECTVAHLLRGRCVDTGEVLHADAQELLDHLLPPLDQDKPNQQRRAAELVVAKRLALVAGGPGTGKTYSVARMLAVLIANAQATGNPVRIALAAPTGKAATRLSETILAALRSKDGEDTIDPSVAQELSELRATTIHRLLGSFGINQHRFRHNADNPLPHDIVVVDETSMVALPLLARLLEAVRPEARLVLIGDPDQLESVELGAVLADLMRAAESPDSVLAPHAVRLLRARRYAGDSPIALLADAVRAGDAERAVAHLSLGEQSDLVVEGKVVSTVRFVEADDPRTRAGVIEGVVGHHLRAARAAAEEGADQAALESSAVSRVLCAHRQGPSGVSEWNRRGEEWLRDPVAGEWYAGRPVLITRNDPRLDLSNGDCGVVIMRHGRPSVVFPGKRSGFDPVQLEGVETAYAMTVHKSQGSEYATVVLILPPHTSPLVGRELVYTGITRAKQHLVVVGSEAALRACILTPARRMTGLAAALG